MAEAFRAHRPERVVNLAAQAGVRYSIENPMAYVDSNLVGFGNILEGCRHAACGHLVFASTYSLIATPETWVVTQITITTATTNHYIVKGAVPWRYLKLVYSLSTNVTLTSDAVPTSF